MAFVRLVPKSRFPSQKLVSTLGYSFVLNLFPLHFSKNAASLLLMSESVYTGTPFLSPSPFD